MPLQLELKKKLNTRTERVKSVDFHPFEPLILSALYNGNVLIHNWEEQVTVKTIEVCPNTAIRCGKFIARKQWIICGSDDMMLHVINFHSIEKIKEFDAHTDFIRYIAIHPFLPLVLTASDDMSVRLWDWSKDWCRVASFEGHLHYVMMCQWNPKDPHIFATASLDRSIKVWGIQAPGMTTGIVINRPHFNLLGHESGVNTVQYSPNSEKPYILSGGDDKTVRIWDYQTKQCVTVLNGHQKSVMCAVFHSYLPIILSGGEDSLVKVWHATTYRQEMSINYDMGRVWSIATDSKTNAVAFATDEGTIVMKIGNDKAVASMQGGKIVLAKGSDIQTVNVKLTDDSLYADGEILMLSCKDLGSCEIFPQSIQHHPKGRLISIFGDGEYIIYTAQALRSKAYGRASDFIWSASGDYAIQEDTGKITIFHNFKECLNYSPSYPVEKLFGGHLIGIKSSDFICFYDWKDFKLKRRINVSPENVYWNETGTHVVLTCEDVFYLLRYNMNSVNNTESEDGIEGAFDLEKEVMEKVDSGCWVSDCFAFTTARLRLHTLTAGMSDTLAFLEKPAWLLGYLSDTNSLYLIDHGYNIISYRLYLSFVEYLSAICRRDFENAAHILKKVPEELHNKVARFLEWQGQGETALEVTHDTDHKFELARSLGKLDLCARIIQEASSNKGAEGAAYYKDHWKQLGDLALERGAIQLSVACFQEAQDYNSMLLVNSSICDVEGLERLAKESESAGVTNVAIMCYILLQDFDKCIDLLINTDCIPEAALFARAYAPSRICEIVKLWKEKLDEANYKSVAFSLANPIDHPQMFPEYEKSLQLEKVKRLEIQQMRQNFSTSKEQKPDGFLENAEKLKLLITSSSTPTQTNRDDLTNSNEKKQNVLPLKDLKRKDSLRLHDNTEPTDHASNMASCHDLDEDILTPELGENYTESKTSESKNVDFLSEDVIDFSKDEEASSSQSILSID